MNQKAFLEQYAHSYHSPETKNRKYFAYVRKSSEPDDRQVLSIDSQKKEVMRAFPHLDIVEVIEESKSAKSPGRPQFDTMIRRLHRGEADGIIAWHPDRLARNSVDGGRIIYELDQGKIKDLKFVQYNFENSAEGKWMLGIVFGQSKYYVDKLSVDVKRGMNEKVERGWRPNIAPLGYLNHVADTMGNRIIIPDPDRFALVRKMWDLMLTGAYSPPRVADIANTQWGLRTVQRKNSGGKPMARSAVYRTFSNPFYYGVFEYNGRLHPGQHPPMITEAEFWRVQEILGKSGRPRPKKKKYFAYTGLIRCGECGCMITAEEKFKRNAHGEVKHAYLYYHCTKNNKQVKCSQSCITVGALEKQIEEALTPISVGDEFLEWALKYLEKIRTAEVDLEKSTIKNRRRALADVRHQLDELLTVRLRGLIEDEEFEVKRKALRKQESQLQGNGNATDDEVEAALNRTEQVCRFAHRLSERFAAGTLEDKKIIVHAVGSNWLLKDGKLALEPDEPYRYFMKSGENSGWLATLEAVRNFCSDSANTVSAGLGMDFSPGTSDALASGPIPESPLLYH